MANWAKQGGMTKQMFQRMLQRIFALPKWPENTHLSEHEEMLSKWNQDIAELAEPTEEEMENYFTLDKIDGIKNFLERCGPYLDTVVMTQQTKKSMETVENSSIEAVFTRVQQLIDLMKNDKGKLR
jgi:hypothetical protein